MTIKITEEQVEYIKSLDSKKKQRKFLLDCLVGSIIGESVKFNFKSKNEIAKDRLNHTPSNRDIEWTEDGLWFFKQSDKNNEIADLPSKEAKIEEKLNRDFFKNPPEGERVDISKISNSPNLDKWLKENPLYTTTTAPRTFEGILNRQEYGTGNFDFGKAYVEAMERIIPKDELLKFDKLDEENSNFPDKEAIAIFEVNKNQKPTLQIYLNVMIKQQRYVLAKIFKNQIEILDLLEGFKTDESANKKNRKHDTRRKKLKNCRVVKETRKFQYGHKARSFRK